VPEAVGVEVAADLVDVHADYFYICVFVDVFVYFELLAEDVRLDRFILPEELRTIAHVVLDGSETLVFEEVSEDDEDDGALLGLVNAAPEIGGHCP
jgi:hypothetical protein